MKRAIYLALILSPASALADPYFVDSEWGDAILSDEKCWVGDGKHALIASAKEFQKVSILGCWEEKDGYVYIWWKKSVGADESQITIDKSERVEVPGTLQKNKVSEDKASEVKELIEGEEGLSDQCRGGSGDDPETEAACEEREEVLVKLQGLGWCWGPQDAIEAEKSWVRCR